MLGNVELPLGFAQQSDFTDDHLVVHGFAHIVDGQGCHADDGEGCLCSSKTTGSEISLLCAPFPALVRHGF